jgi:hypothetical protein
MKVKASEVESKGGEIMQSWLPLQICNEGNEKK